MVTRTIDKKRINGAPTKASLMEMLTKDILAEQAVLDLVDNSVDAAKRINPRSFERRHIAITLSKDTFRILDNCGGFDRKIARDYAFRIGRPPKAPRTPHSVGQFGVGMKRALFKFGNRFIVRSATPKEQWAIDVNVRRWLANEDDWHFPWSTFGRGRAISQAAPGTEIVVEKLREEVAERFGTQQFEDLIVAMIQAKHRQFIAQGLSVTVNDRRIDATDLHLLMDREIKPAVERFREGKGNSAVHVKVIAALGESAPRKAGWYVVCNGRVILEADQRERTGWGLSASNGARRTSIPRYHNQYARFRGIVSIESADASKLPWNTMKTDVDESHPLWQKIFRHMTEAMRPVLRFLDELDRDIDQHSRTGSGLYEIVNSAAKVRVETLTKRSTFSAPKRGSLRKRQAVATISYFRPLKEVHLLKEALGVTSARAVGEVTFDTAVKRHRKT